jgi:hypothetical protein
MTYNFDPDRWYESQKRLLENRLESGEIDEVEYQLELDELDTRYEEMVRRLDGTYTLPDGS